ncbi:hypothetical protein SKAU_G00368230 [Synaphobranchus kaupii]|uniref:Uncharacterized protein n=1 Tax=Synaphobranchus kaupii TaxID=118154 RepID=A0A9Q1EFI8_SYNKA|nr:hypothetical protein SKAU_G00368230 [Synaphobranchus kaupii]
MCVINRSLADLRLIYCCLMSGSAVASTRRALNVRAFRDVLGWNRRSGHERKRYLAQMQIWPTELCSPLHCLFWKGMRESGAQKKTESGLFLYAVERTARRPSLWLGRIISFVNLPRAQTDRGSIRPGSARSSAELFLRGADALGFARVPSVGKRGGAAAGSDRSGPGAVCMAEGARGAGASLSLPRILITERGVRLDGVNTRGHRAAGSVKPLAIRDDEEDVRAGREDRGPGDNPSLALRVGPGPGSEAPAPVARKTQR